MVDGRIEHVAAEAHMEDEDEEEEGGVGGKVYNQWRVTTGDIVANTVFKYQQFLAGDDDLEFGNMLQKIICHSAGIPVDQRLMYWQVKGAKECRDTFKKKRQAVTGAMKKIYQSKLLRVLRDEYYKLDCRLTTVCSRPGEGPLFYSPRSEGPYKWGRYTSGFRW
jgi:hypothetical protein